MPPIPYEILRFMEGSIMRKLILPMILALVFVSVVSFSAFADESGVNIKENTISVCV